MYLFWRANPAAQNFLDTEPMTRSGQSRGVREKTLTTDHPMILGACVRFPPRDTVRVRSKPFTEGRLGTRSAPRTIIHECCRFGLVLFVPSNLFVFLTRCPSIALSRPTSLVHPSLPTSTHIHPVVPSYNSYHRTIFALFSRTPKTPSYASWQRSNWSRRISSTLPTARQRGAVPYPGLLLPHVPRLVAANRVAAVAKLRIGHSPPSLGGLVGAAARGPVDSLTLRRYQACSEGV